jgi:hypothetical protein
MAGPISDREPARDPERNEDENLVETGTLGREKPISQVL